MSQRKKDGTEAVASNGTLIKIELRERERAKSELATIIWT